MLFEKYRELSRSLSSKLTLWYAGLLLLALGISYPATYYLTYRLALTQVDNYLETEGEECRQLLASKGMAGVEEEIRTETQSQGTRDVYFKVLGQSGNLVVESDREPWNNLATDLRPQDAKPGSPLFAFTVPLGSTKEVRMMAMRLSPTDVIVMAESMNAEMQLIRKSMRLLLVAMILIWVAAAVLGWVLARRSMRGILAVKDAAAILATGRGGPRVDYRSRGDEVDLMAQSFNVMSDRIESLLKNLRETNDHMAHELRSPLTAMRGRCELAITQASTPAEVSLTLPAEIIEQCDRMLNTINKLLEISEVQAGVVQMDVAAVDIHKLLTAACDIFQPIADDKGVKIALQPHDEAVIRGDLSKLQRLFSNLVDNAIKYTPSGGSVLIQISRTTAGIEVRVADTGPGIAAHEREVIFERFARGSAAKGLAGNGLGLNLARSIARAHGGDISVSSAEGEGAEFKVTLPENSSARTAPLSAPKMTKR